MTKIITCFTLCLSLFVLGSCTRPSDSTARNAEQQEKVFPVNNAEEFINAIGSNRTIEVSPGDYILSAIPDRYMHHIRWDPEFDGKTITIRNVENLVIKGSDRSTTQLLVNPRYVFVLNFENCKQVTLQGLTLGHTPEKGVCTSGVIGVNNCQDFSIDNCDLFGCGTEGLTLENVQSLSFNNSIIRECSYGIMSIKGCKNLLFNKSTFTKNEQYYGINISDTNKVVFSSCDFSNNKVDGPLFQAISSSNIVLQKCQLELSNIKGLCNNESALTVEP